MSKIGLTYAELVALKPCRERFNAVTKLIGDESSWNGRSVDAKTAVRLGISFDDLVWVATKKAETDKDVGRRVRLWGADCSARVLHIFENRYPSDDRPRKAIQAARDYAGGLITLEAAESAAAAAALAAALAAAAWAAKSAARAAEAAGAARAAWAAREAESAARAVESSTEEREWQFNRLILWLSDEEPAYWPLD